jgi:hypothetical protein
MLERKLLAVTDGSKPKLLPRIKDIRLFSDNGSPGLGLKQPIQVVVVVLGLCVLCPLSRTAKL